MTSATNPRFNSWCSPCSFLCNAHNMCKDSHHCYISNPSSLPGPCYVSKDNALPPPTVVCAPLFSNELQTLSVPLNHCILKHTSTDTTSNIPTMYCHLPDMHETSYVSCANEHNKLDTNVNERYESSDFAASL